MRSTTIAEDLAHGILAHGGVTAILDLYHAAAAAERQGKLEIASSLLEIAEAAERLMGRPAAGEVGLQRAS